MPLELEVWDRSRGRCPCRCGDRRVFYSGALNQDGTRVAMYLVYLYDHGGEREVFTEMALGTFDDGATDRVCFSARTGPGGPGDSGGVRSTLVESTSPADNDLMGRPLAPAEARAHPWLGRFWAFNDALVHCIPEVAAHLSGEPTMGRRSRQRPSHDFAVTLERH